MFHNSASLGSVGGLIRNNAGDWIVGFKKSVGVTASLQAELWGIFEGLNFAWTCGIERLQRQTDCAEAFNLISSPLAPSSSIGLVRSIARLMTKPWLLNFVLVGREANVAADCLAKLPTTIDGLIHIFTNAPQEVTAHTARDLHGTSFIRF
ncbi:hypothetical protein F3Y22_tig00110505pilonHSYRG00083 [Hibiscus syriacus]|uniref:RNase H type-1 domain-containing protein n=1 Tax=Hibiscus syriacus TaxID=106335 RepID=A0A6A3ABB1_HIBSY|nr:hypothetical protein F3Y22_tig00110505pilonHSYRG00083 [Hibiscus syriacus]